MEDAIVEVEACIVQVGLSVAVGVLQLPSSTSRALGKGGSYTRSLLVVPSHISPGAHLVLKISFWKKIILTIIDANEVKIEARSLDLDLFTLLHHCHRRSHCLCHSESCP